MPYINATIPRAWRMRNEPDRIHFILQRKDGQQRRLYADRGQEIFRILDEELLEQGYEGPASARASA